LSHKLINIGTITYSDIFISFSEACHSY